MDTNMSNDPLAAVWVRLEDHSKDIHSVRERIAVIESKHSEIKNKMDDICVQLQITDRRISEKQDLLLAEHHKRQGQGILIGWIPTIISCIVGFASIITIIKGE
jgi:hypothetical protein